MIRIASALLCTTVLLGAGGLSTGLVQGAVAQVASSKAVPYVELLVVQAQKLLAEEPRDPARAALLLGEAAKADNVDAMILLAGLYARGDGVGRDFDVARNWIERAIAVEGAGAGEAWAALGDLYRQADEQHQDAAKAMDAYQKAADLGSRSVLVALATMIADGAASNADLDRAGSLLANAPEDQAAAAAGAWVHLGELYADSDQPGGVAKAVEAFKNAARLGDTTILVRLGQMVGAGEGGAADFALAKQYLEAATSLANAQQREAWAALGDLYRDAAEGERDLALAAKAYEQAADLGNTAVLIPLAQILGVGGKGVTADFERAKALLDQAIALNDSKSTAAWIALGNLYRYAAGANADMSKAAFAYEQAANAGDAVGMVHLARILGTGDGRPVDFPAAKALLEKAIATGRVSAWAWSTLGDLYRGAGDDPAAAAAAFKQAADLGDTGAMLKLAAMLGKGDGIATDFDGAKSLLSKAVAAGGPDTVWAFMALGELYASADPDHRDQSKAIEAYRQALSVEENGAAWYALGDLYGSGDASVRDLAKAIEAYDRAADLGETGALVDHAMILGADQFAEARSLIQKAIGIGDKSVVRAWVALGDLYRNADDAHRDLAAAVKAYGSAAEAGSTSGMIKLARLVGWGEGAKKDFEAARTLLQQAIAANDGTLLWAWVTLGDLYRGADAEHADAARAVEAYEHAANAGDSAAMVKIGEILGRGEGIAPDLKSAEAWLKKAIAANDPDTIVWALGTLADLYDNPGPDRDMPSAAAAYAQAAELGDIGSMIALAQIVGAGDGVPVDFEKARTLLQKAAAADDQNAASAWASLGDLYRDAEGVDLHLAKAADAYAQAAERGHVSSMIKLARIIGWGDTVPEDFDGARQLLQKAIASGGDTTRWAWATLGDLYRRNGEHRDLRKAMEAFGEAVKLGDTGAMIKLAILRNSGARPDFNGARDLLEKAIAAGGENVPWAWSALGDLYFYAGETQRDLEKAAAAYRASAQGGNTGAMVNLAGMLVRGDVVSVSPNEAITLLKTAIAAKDDSAAWAWQTLGDAYRSADPPDVDGAAAAYEQAVALGDPLAMIRLGGLMIDGQGVPADFNKARTLILQAIGMDEDNAPLGWATLGDLYRKAPPPHRDIDRAIRAYERAIAEGDPGAMVELARLLGLEHEGVKPDFPRARLLLDDAVLTVENPYYIGDSLDLPIWLAYGDIYRFGPARYANASTALKYYEKAAELGNAYAHLSAAELGSLTRAGSAERIRAMVDHYRKAAAAMGVSEVAKVMYKLDPASLYYTTQGFLADLNPGSLGVDGVLGPKTAGAITAYCQANGLSCAGDIVTFDLLETLLRAKSPAGATEGAGAAGDRRVTVGSG